MYIYIYILIIIIIIYIYMRVARVPRLMQPALKEEELKECLQKGTGKLSNEKGRFEKDVSRVVRQTGGARAIAREEAGKKATKQVRADQLRKVGRGEEGGKSEMGCGRRVSRFRARFS